MDVFSARIRGIFVMTQPESIGKMGEHRGKKQPTYIGFSKNLDLDLKKNDERKYTKNDGT